MGHSKPTYGKDTRTSEADVDDPITGDGMKKRKREEDTNAHTKTDPHHTKRRAADGCAMNEVKPPDFVAKRKPKRNAARKPSTRNAIMKPQRSVAQLMKRFSGGNETQ